MAAIKSTIDLFLLLDGLAGLSHIIVAHLVAVLAGPLSHLLILRLLTHYNAKKKKREVSINDQIHGRYPFNPQKLVNYCSKYTY